MSATPSRDPLPPSWRETLSRQARLPGRPPIYRLADDQLEMGASFGNARCWVNTRGTGSIEQIFACDLGVLVYGAIAVRYTGVGSRLVRVGARREGGRPRLARRQAFAQLRPDGRGQIEIHPCYQRHEFHLPGGLRCEETVFVPRAPGIERAAAYQVVEIANVDDRPLRLRVYAFARLRGRTAPDIEAAWDPELGALVACNRSRPEWVRCFGCLGATVAGWETSFDFSQVYEPNSVGPLRCDTTASGDVLGALQVDVALEPGERQRFAFQSAFCHQGAAAARAGYLAGGMFEDVLRRTLEDLEGCLVTAEVMTPDPVINEGAAWAKVNMRRVMCDFPQGRAFTNDPSQSSAVVARDCFWFTYGCDHLDPAFSRALLDAFTARQQPGGKIIEYFDAVTGREEDYGLNVNDNTPLYILAVNHHWRSTGDRAWLERTYPAVLRAARYLVSQRDERGLVVCTARGTGVHGICGWRNVIDGYTLSGAVTEVNAECAAALRAAGHLAENLGRAMEAEELFGHAHALCAAINRHLLNPQNGLYYLNIDLDGHAHSDVTGDQVFPVIFRVSPPDVGYRVISRLNSPDFLTEAGLRTASRDSLEYEPFRYYGLLGGVWPGLTWWYAFAAARHHREAMVGALRASFQHYNRAPRQNNTVPGQFSEWFDGESLVNRGMRLSPWEAPRFLWAAVEGVCGVMLRPGELHVLPLIPDAWDWVALRRLPFQGASVTFFAGREAQGLRCYATHDVRTDQRREVYPEDVSERVVAAHPDVHHVALRRPGEVVVCLGNASGQTSVSPLLLGGALAPGARYQVDVYNSELHEWLEGETGVAEDLGELAVSINARGYRVLRFRGVPLPGHASCDPDRR